MTASTACSSRRMFSALSSRASAAASWTATSASSLRCARMSCAERPDNAITSSPTSPLARASRIARPTSALAASSSPSHSDARLARKAWRVWSVSAPWAIAGSRQRAASAWSPLIIAAKPRITRRKNSAVSSPSAGTTSLVMRAISCTAETSALCQAAEVACMSSSAARPASCGATADAAAISGGMASRGRPRRRVATPSTNAHCARRTGSSVSRLSALRQRERLGVASDQGRQRRGPREPASALPAVARQRRSALERLRGRRVPAALDGALGRFVERVDHALVGLEGRGRQVPGAAVRLLVVALERGRERPVDGAPLGRGRRRRRPPSARAGGETRAARRRR